MSHNIKETNRL